MSVIPFCVPVINTIPHAITSTTTVLIAVARLEFTPSIPIFANMEVKAANTADNTAYTNHIIFISSFLGSSFVCVTTQTFCIIGLRVLPGAYNTCIIITYLFCFDEIISSAEATAVSHIKSKEPKPDIYIDFLLRFFLLCSIYNNLQIYVFTTES